jgi:hypothetical protein
VSKLDQGLCGKLRETVRRESALHQTQMPYSAEGAEYDSQGQAVSGARRVAPGTTPK